MIRFNPAALESVPFLRQEELEKLHHLAAEFTLGDFLQNPRAVEDRVLESVYVSSRMEGSRYSWKGASALLKYGFTEGGQPLSDALMIVNLGKATDHVMANSRDADVINRAFIQDLHARITSAHLQPSARGSVRNQSVTIGGSRCVPPESSDQLETEFGRLIETAAKIEDPFEQALYVHCSLACLQCFADGNKRTARLMQTAVMIRRGLVPVFFRESDIPEYLQAMIAYCETGNRRPCAELFVRAYQYTIDDLLNRTEEHFARVREDEERIRRYRSGQR